MDMMKRYNVWLDSDSLKKLAKIGQAKGGLKVAQLIRVAIHEYISRERTTQNENSSVRKSQHKR